MGIQQLPIDFGNIVLNLLIIVASDNEWL